MSPEVFRNALEAYLAPLVKAHKGTLSMALDFDDASTRLGMAPTGWQLVFGWEGFDSFEDGDLSTLDSIVWSGYFFIVERNKGLPAKAGGDLPALERLVGLVISWIRAVRFQDDSGNTAGLDFQRSGWERVQSDQAWRRHEVQARLLTALSAAPEVILRV
jgi:hypothetical protein